MFHLIHPMIIIIVEHDFSHLLKQHQSQQQHIQGNQLVVLLNQVEKLAFKY
jgi:predicted SprT family Zn-dependent metalloprotease